MGKKDVTLFERVKHDGVHNYFDGHVTHAPAAIAEDMRNAVPFVVDASGLTTAMSLRNSLLRDQQFPLPDLALCPFDSTWIEYDPRAKMRGPVDPLTAEKVGHLIWRSNSNQHRLIKGGEGVCVLSFEYHPTRRTPMMLPFVFNWTKEPQDYSDSWMHHVGEKGWKREFTPSTTDYVRKILLTGQDWAPTWKDRFGGDLFQPVPKGNTYDEAQFLGVHVQRCLTESAAVASLLMGILALIAWCPVEKIPAKHQGLWVSRRGAKPHLNHTVVRIAIPIRRAYAGLKRAYKESIIHKRRHKVREHLRVLYKGTDVEKIILVHEHERGDISLGYCQQSYKVV